MVRYRFHPLWLLFLLLALLVTGCAHQTNSPDLATVTDSVSDQTLKIVTPDTNQMPTKQASQDPIVESEAIIGDNTDVDIDSDFESGEFDMFEDELEEAPVVVYDPLEPFNRVMFQFTDKLYYWALKPMARTYKTIIPRDIRRCVKNFFDNIRTPVRLVNCILQGKTREAGAVFGRFFINTTAGLLGLGNPAATLEKYHGGDEDLGQTLAAYGIGDGAYIFLPILGPYTLRDAAGYVGDLFLSPFSYLDSVEASLGIFGFRMVNDTSFRIGDYEALKEAALDPYVAVRNIYLQHRQNKIKE